MESLKMVLRETGMIALGEVICVAVMIAVFALLGAFNASVLWGGIIGAIVAVLNFLLMAINASTAADKAVAQDVKGGAALMKTSYVTRMLVIFVVLAACVKGGLCNPLACVLPLVFVRPILMVAEFFRKSGEKKA